MQKSVSTLVLCLATSAAIAQIPCRSSNLGTNLLLADETVSSAQPLGFTFVYNGVGYTDIQVCDNGYVTLGASGGLPDFSPDPLTLVSDPFPRICPLWIDLEPGVPGGGDVWFNAVPATRTDPAYAVVTWDGVYEYAGTTPHTFQMILIDGGTIRTSYGADLTNNPQFFTWLIGASPGNGAAQNPVSFASLPIITAGNATLHEDQQNGGPVPYAGQVFEWVPDGSGGYVVTENLTCAGVTPFGVGCVGRFGSFYEHFLTTPSIDLSNTTFSLINTGGTYVVTSGGAPFMPLSGTAQNLNLGDDDETQVPLTGTLPFPGGTTMSLNICSNGHISTASNGAEFDYTPTPGEFINWPNATWAVWRDFIPNATGNVFFDEVPGVGCTVTWDGVIGYVGTNPGTVTSTFQIQFDYASGNVTFVFLAMDTVSVSTWTGGEGWVVGFSPAGASNDPGSVDLSAVLGAGSLVTYNPEILPLALSATGLPVVNTTMTLDTSNIPAGAPFGAILLGLAQFNPGIPLDSIGMAGCFRYTDGAATILFLPSGSTHSTNFTAPNAPGFSINAQSAVYAPASGLTVLGAIASGALDLRLGN